jgi:carboxypeptidase family protein
MGVIAVCALVLAVPAGAATGGLRGVVTRGPVTPVCKVGTPCDAPAKNVTVIFVRNGVSRSVTTDDSGRYLIRLGAGTWAVRIPSAAKFGFKPQTAYVRAGVVRVQNFSIDTGIR